MFLCIILFATARTAKHVQPTCIFFQFLIAGLVRNRYTSGGDHRGGRAKLGRRTFMMTCLRWILGYMRLEIWRKIGLSGDWMFCTALRTRSGARYYCTRFLSTGWWNCGFVVRAALSIWWALRTSPCRGPNPSVDRRVRWIPSHMFKCIVVNTAQINSEI